MVKVLKQDSEIFKKLELLNDFLANNDIEICTTIYKGLILRVGKNYFKHSSEGERCENIPPLYEGRYILCDSNGNTDFYQED